MMSRICSIIMQDGGSGWGCERPSPLAMDLRNVGTGLWIYVCQCTFLLSCLILCMFKIHHNNNIKKKLPGEPLQINSDPSEWHSWFGERHRHCFCLKCCVWSVVHSSLTLCNPMDCSTPGLSVPHHLPKFAQVHVHCIGDAVQPSHHLMPSSLSALSLSQHQGLFQWVSCSHQMTKMLELQL